MVSSDFLNELNAAAESGALFTNDEGAAIGDAPPAEAVTPAEGEAPPAEPETPEGATGTPDEGSESEVEAYEIPDVGTLTADELRDAIAAKDKVSKLEADKAELETRMAVFESREKELGAASTLNALLEIPEFRVKVQQLVDEFAALDPATLTKDGGQLDTSKISDPRVDQLLKDLEPMKAIAQEQARDRLLAQRDAMKAQFIAEYPGIVTEEVFNQVQDAAAKKYGASLHFPELESEMYRHIATTGLTAARRGAAADALKKVTDKGSRVVVVKAQGNDSKKAPAVSPPVNRKEFLSQLRENGIQVTETR